MIAVMASISFLALMGVGSLVMGEDEVSEVSEVADRLCSALGRRWV